MLSLKAIGEKLKEVFSEGVIKVDSAGSNLPSRSKIIFLNKSISAPSIASGTVETVTIQPPAGKIWKIIDFYFKASPPTGATTGYHYMTLNYNNFEYAVPYPSSDYATTLEIRTIPSTYSGLHPTAATPGDFLHYYRGLKASNENYLEVMYGNSTDVTQTNPIYIKFIIEEFDEAV